jgi:hypothetical protein
MYSIYYLERNSTPFYIGKAKNVVRRKHAHHSKFGSNIELIVIDEVEDWKYWETFYIWLFRSWGFVLLNKNNGGGGPSTYSEEQKNKMRKPRPGSGAKISKTLKENNHSKYYTKEIRDKISKGSKGISRPFTNSHTTNMGLAKLKQAKIVLQFNLDGSFVREWKSKGLAAKYLKEITGKTSNITSQIKDCILGKQKTAYGFKWKYKNE